MFVGFWGPVGPVHWKVGVLRVWNFNVAAMFRGRWGRLTKMDHVGVPWNESTKQVCFAIWDCCWVSKAFGEPSIHVRVQMSVAFVSMLTVPVVFWCPQFIWWSWWCWVGSIPKNKCHTLRVLQDYICASTRLGLFLSYALCDLDKVQPGYLYRPSCEMFPKRIFTYHI